VYLKQLVELHDANRHLRGVPLGAPRSGCSDSFRAIGTYVRDRSAERTSAFRRAIERRALWLAEDAARELPKLSLEDALQLVHLYAERGSPKYEKAALRWLSRYLDEHSPTLHQFASVARDLAARQD